MPTEEPNVVKGYTQGSAVSTGIQSSEGAYGKYCEKSNREHGRWKMGNSLPVLWKSQARFLIKGVTHHHAIDTFIYYQHWKVKLKGKNKKYNSNVNKNWEKLWSYHIPGVTRLYTSVLQSLAQTCLNTPAWTFQVYLARPWLAASGVFD